MGATTGGWRQGRDDETAGKVCLETRLVGKRRVIIESCDRHSVRHLAALSKNATFVPTPELP